MKLLTVFAVALGLVGPFSAIPQHGPARAATSPAVDKRQLLPPAVFGRVEDETCAPHRAGLYDFFNGNVPGRHDPYADIVGICGGYLAADGRSRARVEAALPCGPTASALVVCSPSNPPFGQSGQLLVFAMQLRGPVPRQLPVDQTGRYSLFIDGGGDPRTKTRASAAAPDVATQGTNLIYQVVVNDPGTTGSDVGLLAVDRRRAGDEFIQSTARAWLHGNVVTFVVPGSEIGQIDGVRAGTFFGSRAAQDDPRLGEQEVAPGGRHPPWPLLAYHQRLF